MSKISELSDGGSIQSGDTLIAVRSGGNVKVTYGGTTTANIDGGTIDGTVIGGSSAAAGSFTTISASGEIAANGGVAFGDNDKAVFGASDDLEIYHDGSNSWVADKGTGDLYVATNGHSLYLYDQANAKTMAQFVAGGASRLHYDNAIKIATTSTGIDVTGIVTADGLTVANTSVIAGDFSGGTAATYIRVQDPTDNWFYGSNVSLGSFLFKNETADVNRFMIGSNGDLFGYNATGTAKLLWDASAESLGIGTTSPAFYQGSGLEIERAGTATLRLQNTTSGKSAEVKLDTDLILETINTGSVIKFNTAATERARIDASGILLVGKSGAGTNTEGAQFDSNGRGNFTVDANFGLLVNRKTSDGELARFQKDGTTVGSISSTSGTLMSLGTGNTGFLFDNTVQEIKPWNITTNAAADAAVTLGGSTRRFKNLYLSGGVYLGGTGADNLLDDYESGTFTPTPEGSATAGTFTNQARSGHYVKVGDTVHISLLVFVTDFTGTGNFQITGLPFSIGGSSAILPVQANTAPWASLGSDNQNITAYGSGTTLTFRATSRIAGGNYQVAQCGGSTTVGYVRVTGTYSTL